MTYENCVYKSVCQVEDCRPSCIRLNEMSALLDGSNIPPAKQRPMLLQPESCDLQAFQELANVKTNIKSFVEQGRNLYIVSEYTGNGKTTWAIKLMLKYFDEIWAGNGFRERGFFVSVPWFLSKCKDFGTKDETFEKLKANLLNYDLVIWDDIGSTYLSGYDLSQLTTFVDQRILYEKSNIFTGNLNEDEMLKAVGERLTSRVYKASKVVTFYGKDRREDGNSTVTSN